MSRISVVRKILEDRFSPTELEVDDFSNEHNVPSGSESHLRIRIVADIFQGQRQVKRHRLIYGVLGGEMKSGLHALQLQTLTPSEVAEKLTSPKCRGGEVGQ